LATFQAQVQGLTSLSVGTTPTTGELTEFLKDGVIDVTNRWLAIHPQDIGDFQRKSDIIDSNGGLDLNSARIISVVRENEADGSSDGSTAWRPCSKISPSMQSQVVDTESLSFASKYHPVYMIDENGKINVYPTPDGTNDGYRIYYVNNVPTDLTNEVSLTYAHSDLKYFPSDKVYLVVLYASIKTVGAVMGNSVISLTSVPPDVPTIGTVSYSPATETDIGSVSDVSTTTVDISGAPEPAYNGNAVVGLADGTLTVEMEDTALSVTDLSIKAVPPDVPSLTSISYSDPGATDASLTNVAAGGVLGSSTQPSYDTSVADTAIALVTSKIADASTFTSTNEDVELAASKLSEVGAVINDANLRIQDQLNIFNEENIKYQASVQESMAEFQSQNQMNIQNAANSNNRLLQNAVQDAKVILDNNAQAIQKYQTEIAEYQAEVGTEVQEWQANTTKDLQVWQQTNAMALQEHSARMQDALNLFNEQNVEYQAEVQEKVQQAQILNQESIQNMQKDLARAQADAQSDSARRLQDAIQTTQATVANNAALVQKYQTEISHYQAEVAAETQEQSTKMQQYQLLYNQLKAEYDQAFMIAAPRQQAEA
tara:strand:- start:421 stop:2217 length:1797 start_codon:yes stop_codon:yes gene_type:complete